MDEVYEELRPLMFSIAYRMLGSATEAEDIVQEAFLRFHRETSEGTQVDSPKAYLSAVTTRLSIDHFRSARVRRERYVGTWLPEPLLTDTEDEVGRHAETADSLSMGFLVLLESLTPVERAVFLLREVFEYGFDEIARIVGKTEENCRQISVRARQARPRQQAAVRGIARAARGARAAVLRRGRRRRPRRPRRDARGRRGRLRRRGREGSRVPAARSTAATRSPGCCWAPRPAPTAVGVVELRPVEINGQPGALLFDRDDRPVVAIALDIADDRVQTIRAVSNPEKLHHLGRSKG